MGCGSSNATATAPEANVVKQRRRLSVGNVDTSDVHEIDDHTTQEDRGLIAQFNQQNLLDMIQRDGQPAKGRRNSAICSSTDQNPTSFANKTMQQYGDELQAAQHGLGYTCRKGLKPESPNQDSWCMLKTEDFSIYGVFDGHGQKGHDVSNFVKDVLPKLIVSDPRAANSEWPAILTECFRKTQSMVHTSDKMKQLNAQMSGTTATLAVHDHRSNKITVAHVADSTAVLGTKNGSAWEGVALTRDHKPNLRDEKQRIEKAGGRVVFDGYANHRVYAKNARYPGLNMSRCIGDLLGHQDCGISCEPEIATVEASNKERILFLCSDGVWEFITPQEAVTLIHHYTSTEAQKAADFLAKEAWDRWIREEGGAVVDDITVILVYLKPA